MDPRGKWRLKAKSYYSFGTSLHNVLQRFHDSDDQGVTTTHEALAALEESWIDAGYESQDHMMQAMSEGKDLVAGYLDRVAAAPTGAKSLYIERLLSLDMGDWRLIGRVDRVDEHPDGSLEIIDYKTGRSSVSDEEVAGDLAMGIYQVLLEEKHPGTAIRATILALRSGDSGTASLSNQEKEQLLSDLRLLAEEIFNRDWDEVEPAPKPLCRGCDFLPLCLKHPGFEPPAPE